MRSKTSNSTTKIKILVFYVRSKFLSFCVGYIFSSQTEQYDDESITSRARRNDSGDLEGRQVLRE